MKAFIFKFISFVCDIKNRTCQRIPPLRFARLRFHLSNVTFLQSLARNEKLQIFFSSVAAIFNQRFMTSNNFSFLSRYTLNPCFYSMLNRDGKRCVSKALTYSNPQVWLKMETMCLESLVLLQFSVLNEDKSNVSWKPCFYSNLPRNDSRLKLEDIQSYFSDVKQAEKTKYYKCDENHQKEYFLFYQ